MKLPRRPLVHPGKVKGQAEYLREVSENREIIAV